MMNTGRRPRLLRGFTLIELMIVVAIAAVLTAIALPSYQAYVMKARRVTAITALERAAAAREKFLLANNVYPTSLAQLQPYGVTVLTPGDDYLISIHPGPTTTFRATARNPGRQQHDARCWIFFLNADTNQRTSWNQGGATNPQPDPCWSSS